jgi:hypothetical protein
MLAPDVVLGGWDPVCSSCGSGWEGCDSGWVGSSDNVGHIPVWDTVRSLFPCGDKRA